MIEPRFTYHGFRYVQVTGLNRKPALGKSRGAGRAYGLGIGGGVFLLQSRDQPVSKRPCAAP